MDGWIVEVVFLIIFKVINLFWNQIALGCNLLLVLSFDANSCFCAKSLTAFRPERNCETSRPWKPNLPRGRSQRPSRNNWKRWVRPICICQNPICDFFCILRFVENTFLSGVPESWCDGGDRSLGEDGGIGVSNSIRTKTLTHKFISHFSWEHVGLCQWRICQRNPLYTMLGIPHRHSLTSSLEMFFRCVFLFL